MKYFMEIIRLGFPIGLMFLIEVGAISVASILMARFGTVALAAQQLAMQFLGVTINIPYALGQAVAIRIGMNAGQQNRKGVFNACNVGVIMSISLMAIIAIFYIFFPRLLIKIDLNLHDPKNLVLIKQTSSFLIILGVFQLFDCIRIIAVSVLRALKDTKFALYISIISFWLIGISVGLILSMYFHMRGEGIWIGLCLGVIFGAIVLIIRAYRKLSHINLKELVVL